MIGCSHLYSLAKFLGLELESLKEVKERVKELTGREGIVGGCCGKAPFTGTSPRFLLYSFGENRCCFPPDCLHDKEEEAFSSA